MCRNNLTSWFKNDIPEYVKDMHEIFVAKSKREKALEQDNASYLYQIRELHEEIANITRRLASNV